MSVVPSFYLPMWVSTIVLFGIPISLYFVLYLAKIETLFDRFNPLWFCISLVLINFYLLCIIDTSFFFFSTSEPIYKISDNDSIPYTVIIFFLGLGICIILLINIFYKNFKKRYTINNKLLRRIFIISSVLFVSLICLFLLFDFKGCYFRFAPPDSIEFKTVPNFVSPGEKVKLMIKGEPLTAYGINIEYNSGYSEANGLIEQTTNEFGYANWYWKIGTNTISGTYPIKVTNLETHYTETTYFTVK